MRVDDLARLYDYDRWANERIFRAISRLSPQQFTQNVAGSYGSVRSTLVHMLSAEWGWLERCGGQPRGPRLNADAFPTVESVTELRNRVAGYVREFLGSLKDEDIARTIEYSFGGGPQHATALGDLMHHAANHSVHHRGQVALLLRMLGVVPGDFDLLYYHEERQSVPTR